MSNKIVLLGMNNPLSADPRMALWPHPPGVTGHRIWKMINMRLSCSTEQYKEAFDRQNILDSQEWMVREARLAAPQVWERLQGRYVIVLGREAADVLDLQFDDWILENQKDDVTYRMLPHPSGLNRWYNESINLNLAAVLLEEMYLRSLGII